MDFTKIEANYNVAVNLQFATAGNSLTQPVYCPFTPDFLIVRGINYSPGGTDNTTDVFRIYSDLVDGHVLGSITMSLSTTTTPALFVAPSPQILYFKMNKPVQSQFQFSVWGNLTTVTLNGHMVIHLEFVKFKAEKPQQIY
jgi:hypothetical protein